MNIVTLHRLVDAPLSLDAARQERIQKVAEMADILVSTGTYTDRDDAILILLARGYSRFEVHACIEDVSHVALEHVVAMEMSEP
jgi:hypothetical protein